MVKARLMEAIAPGVTTLELDRIAEDEVTKSGATPSFKGYMGAAASPFPATICTSLNEEIVHGIPGSRVLQDGDILSVDVGAIVEYADQHTFPSPTVIQSVQRIDIFG